MSYLYLALGQLCPICQLMRGRELIARIRNLGRKNGVAVRVESKRGKGSHITLYYGSRHTIVKDRKKEIRVGLLQAMCTQLGISPGDL